MGDIENRCICLSISTFEPRSWLNSQPSFRSTANSFLTCHNEVCQPKEAILMRIHLATHHHWFPYLPSAICVGFGMHRARYHHNEVHCSLSGTCTQAQTMSPYQAPRLSPWGTHWEWKLVGAWKPTFIIIRLLGQYLTTNISTWNYSQILGIYKATPGRVSVGCLIPLLWSTARCQNSAPRPLDSLVFIHKGIKYPCTILRTIKSLSWHLIDNLPGPGLSGLARTELCRSSLPRY